MPTQVIDFGPLHFENKSQKNQQKYSKKNILSRAPQEVHRNKSTH
jgi:hypothetical protein